MRDAISGWCLLVLYRAEWGLVAVQIKGSSVSISSVSADAPRATSESRRM